MKAVRLHGYHQQPVIDEVPEPTISGPLDVIVKIGGAGVCRTDLHIIEGQWDAAMDTAAALHPRPRERRLGARGRLGGHQRGRRRHGHPAPDRRPAACAAPAGPATTCTASNSEFPGLSRDGGMAEYLLHLGPGLRQARPGDPARRTSRRSPTPASPPTTRSARPSRCSTRAPPRVVHRRGRPRPHRHPVPGRADRHDDHRGRPQPRRAEAGRAARRAPHRGRRRQRRSTRSRT